MTKLLSALLCLTLCGVADASDTEDVFPIDLPGLAETSDRCEFVAVGGQEDAKAVRVAASVGQYGWCSISLPQPFKPGHYKASFTLATQTDSAGVSLYAAGDAASTQINHRRHVVPGKSRKFTEYFYSPRPFDRILIKKMDDSHLPTAAVLNLSITDLHNRSYPRIEAYRRVMAYPAPWGLRSKKLEGDLEDIADQFERDPDTALKRLEAVEAWLDSRSLVADLCARFDHLQRVAQLTAAPLQENTQSAKALLARLREAIVAGRVPEIDKKAEELDARLVASEEALNDFTSGTVRTEKGTDIFTWIKDWNFLQPTDAEEFSEPTPFRAELSGGAVIRLMDVGKPVDIESTWTTSTYHALNRKIIYSVLTPLTVIECGRPALTFEHEGLREGKLRLKDGAATFRSGKFTLLLISTQPMRELAFSSNRVTIGFDKPAAVGYVMLSSDMESRLRSLIDFYRRILVQQPIQCVQIQRGRDVEQIFQYISRDSAWNVSREPVAPLPHLAGISLEPGSALAVDVQQELIRSPDGWFYAAGTEKLFYRLPQRPGEHTVGINVWLNTSPDEIYSRLKQQRCQTVRLVCGASLNWDWDARDVLKEKLQAHLAAAGEAGITVGIDMHNKWIPKNLRGEMGFRNEKLLAEFVQRWKAIIEWCAPYPRTVGWYDLMNEPHIFFERESVQPYIPFMRRAIDQLRSLDPQTPMLVEGVNMANPNGMRCWQNPGEEKVIAGFHDYWPHMFTHQRVVERGDRAAPAVFYPSFMPMIEWSAPSWNNNSRHWHYWDRWKCDAISRPVLELMIRTGVITDCGEYGVVGYAGQASTRSSVLWLRHTLQRLARIGINHNVWSTRGGYTWNVPAFREEILRFWQSRNAENVR